MVFYDLNGNEVSIESIRNEMIANYDGDLTDFNDGSEILSIYNGIATAIYGAREQIDNVLMQIHVDTAYDAQLDEIAAEPKINLTRNEGTNSVGEVVFTLNEVQEEDFLIEEGTILIANGNLEYETTADCIIPAGETNNIVSVEALEVGVQYNIKPHKIELYEPSDAFSVDNPYNFTDGSNYEEDEEFRERIMEHASVSDFGSAPYYIHILTEEFGDNMHDVVVKDCNCDYTAVIVPNTYYYDQARLNAEVQNYLNNQMYVQCGQSFTVQSPSVKEMTYIVSDSEPETMPDFWIKPSESKTSEEIAKFDEVLQAYIKGGSVDGLGAPVEFFGLNLEEEFNMTINALAELLEWTVTVTFDTGVDLGLDGYMKYNIVLEE